MQKKQITQFSFWEFCVAVQAAVKEGYEFSTDNDKMPTAYVGNYNCVMIKQQESLKDVSKTTQDASVDATEGVDKGEAEKDAVETPKESSEDKKEPSTKGRKPKNK